MLAAIDTWWDELSRPDPYVVAVVGLSARSSPDPASARCRAALRLVIVDEQLAETSVEEAAIFFGPTAAADDEDEERQPVPGSGPIVARLGSLPGGDVGVVVALGYLSGLPADRFRRKASVEDGSGWDEVRWAATAEPEQVGELLVPASSEQCDRLEMWAGDRVAPGEEVAVQTGAAAWLSDALGAFGSGRVAVVDRIGLLTGPISTGPPVLWLDQLASLRKPFRPPTGAFSPFHLVAWEAGSR